MRLRLAAPIPRDWTGHPDAKGLLLDRDLRIGTSRLRAKLLVFDSTAHLKRFWSRGIGKGSLGRYCRGAVNGLSIEKLRISQDGAAQQWIEADPRYFCVIGLARRHLSMEIICHEAAHAAFCYVKRITRSPWDVHAKDFDEECICYPAGRIAAAINRVLHGAGLYGA